jgi:gluconolactonase
MTARLFAAPALHSPAAAARGEREKLFETRPLTKAKAFAPATEGPACDAEGNVYAVNYARDGTIGRVAPSGKGEVFVTLPGKSAGNGIVFDKKGMPRGEVLREVNVLGAAPSYLCFGGPGGRSTSPR